VTRGLLDFPHVASLTGAERVLLDQAGVTKTASVDDFAAALESDGIVFAGVGDCVGNNPATGTDDAPAMRAAIALAVATGERVIRILPLPAGRSYKFASRVLVNAPVQIIGQAGAMFGKGNVQITLAAGIESAFTVSTGAASEGGPGGEGAMLFGLEIVCTPTVTVSDYAANTALTVGQYIRRTKTSDANLYMQQVTRAGTTANLTEAQQFDPIEPHVPDRSSVFVPGQAVYLGTSLRSSDNTHWDRCFYVTNAGAGVAGAEPAWNYTLGATTTANGISYRCDLDSSSFYYGTAVASCRIMSGLYLMAPCHVEDVLVRNAQTAGITIIGNGANETIGSNAQRVILRDVRVKLPGGSKGVGVYTRGGEFRSLTAINVQVEGSALAGQGVSAMPTNGTQNEHGIIDRGFAGASMWTSCNVRFCYGFDYWGGAGGNSTSAFVNCTSEGGRVRVEAATVWVGQGNGVFWTGSGQGYASSAPAIGTDGLHNAFETSGSLTALMNPGGPLWAMKHASDGGYNAFIYSGGRYQHAWLNASRVSFAVTNTLVPDSAAFPNGEDAGAMGMPRGFSLGADDTDTRVFATLADYRGPLRGGFRRVGDICYRPDRVAASAFAADIVTTAGWAGPVWTATTAKAARSALVADVVVPTSGAILNVFKCTTSGTTGGTEPSWASAPTIGNTIADGSVVWTNVGVRAITKTIWQISA